MMTKKQLLEDPAKLRDRARGVMAGLAIGDSFGDASRKPENQLAYGITTDFGDGAAWSTDDTEFGLLTAQTLIECGGRLTRAAVADAWRAHVVSLDRELNRGGASEMEAAENLRRGLEPPFTGLYNSFGHSDGAAMRAAPIGVAFAGDLAGAARAAETDACVSHSRDGVWGAQAVACAVAAAMAGAGMEEILSAAIAPVPEDSWLHFAMRAAFDIVDAAGGDFLKAWMPLHDRLATRYKAATAEAVAQAFGVLRLCHGDFKTGVIAAGNFGRDADTIGAICGAILGAHFGIANLPARWVEKTRYPTGTCLPVAKGMDVLEVADRLAVLNGPKW